MTSDSKEQDRRFDETVKNLLNTPPQEHKPVQKKKAEKNAKKSAKDKLDNPSS